MDLIHVVQLALVILAAGLAACVFAHFIGKKSWTAVSFIAAAFIWLALVILRYPVQTHPINIFERHLVTFIEALKYFSLSKPFLPLTLDPLPAHLSEYYCLEIVLSVAAPACTAVVVLALLQKAGRVRRWLMPWRPVYYFSELNEKSYALARNISTVKRTGKALLFTPILVFCKVDPRDNGNTLRFRNEARELDAVFYADPIYAIPKADPWFREVKVFLIDMDENANMSSALKMKDWIIGVDREDHTSGHTDSDLLVFSTENSAELLFNRLLNEVKSSRIRILTKRVSKEDIQALPKGIRAELKQKAIEDTAPGSNPKPLLHKLLTQKAAEMLFDREESRLNLHLINETRQVTQKLLLEHPLYEAVYDTTEEDHISVLVVGCGYLGTQFLKTAMLCGMMDSYSFDIQVIDQQADHLKKQFLHDHPFLRNPDELPEAITDFEKNYIAPKFHQAMVCTEEFDRILTDHCEKCNYIVVTTGDDELNVTTAQYLQRWYARKAINDGSKITAAPLLFAAVRSPERYDTLKTLEEPRFRLFANNMEIYSVDDLLERPLDTVAAMFHTCYNGKEKTYDKNQLLQWNNNMQQDSKRRLLRMPLMIQRSNQIVALHSLYKLQDLLHWCSRAYPDTEMSLSLTECTRKSPQKAFFLFVRLIKNRGTALYDLEHRRWTLFHALNGWSLYPHKSLFDRLKQTTDVWHTDRKIHKDNDARLHGCMIPTEELQKFAQKLGEHTGNTYDFEGNDRAMCVASLFAWLELAVDEETSHTIRAAILDSMPKASEKVTIQAMLDHIYAMDPEVIREPATV